VKIIACTVLCLKIESIDERRVWGHWCFKNKLWPFTLSKHTVCIINIIYIQLTSLQVPKMHWSKRLTLVCTQHSEAIITFPKR